MDKNYWKNYYESKTAPEQPSLFARFVLENYLIKGDSLIELGCGNGRDSLFFARHNIVVTAIDQCDNEISLLNKKNDIENLNFIIDDFTNLKENVFFDNVYSRFTLHSITEKEGDRVIKWAYNQINSGGKFFIEVRGKENELYKKGVAVKDEQDSYIYENHYRRFVDIEKLKSKLKAIGFDVILAEEKSGFAPFKNTDYKFIRMIGIKK